MSTQADFAAVNRLMVTAAGNIDRADRHFAQRPPRGRALDDEEVVLLQHRREARIVLRQIRDSAGAFLAESGQGPDPFQPGEEIESVLDEESQAMATHEA